MRSVTRSGTVLAPGLDVFGDDIIQMEPNGRRGGVRVRGSEFAPEVVQPGDGSLVGAGLSFLYGRGNALGRGEGFGLGLCRSDGGGVAIKGFGVTLAGSVERQPVARVILALAVKGDSGATVP